MQINFSEQDASSIYHLMTQTIIPRPIAWVLTDSGSENYNLAPFSYFTPIASQPPIMMFSVGKKPTGELKDTAANAKLTEKMVIHIAASSDAEVMTNTAATLPHGRSEVVENKIELVEFEGFSLPRVKSCPIAFACKLYEIKEVGSVPQTLVFAEIEQVYIDDTVLDSRTDRIKVDAIKVDPIARLGGGEYAILKDAFSVNRPK